VRNTPQLFRLISEMIFMLAGALLLWVALTNQYLFNARRPSWLVLAVILVLWGLRTWRRARIVAVRWLKLGERIGSLSLVAVGLIMLSLAWVPLLWAGPLLAIAGGIFIARGLVNAAMLAVAS
jgi:hypothetical protein